jgi:hypothetical protein
MIDKYYSYKEEQRALLNNAYDEAIKNIPLELRVTNLNDKIKRILNSIKSCPNKEILKLQIKLLSISLHQELNRDLHVSFTNIINDIEPDELKILINVHKNDYEFVQTLDYEQDKGFFNKQYTKFDYPKDELENPEKFWFYIFHLQDMLKLISWPIYRQDPLIEQGKQIGLVKLSRLIETEYGFLLNKCLFN